MPTAAPDPADDPVAYYAQHAVMTESAAEVICTTPDPETDMAPDDMLWAGVNDLTVMSSRQIIRLDLGVLAAISTMLHWAADTSPDIVQTTLDSWKARAYRPVD